MRDRKQRERLALEEKVLKQEFSDFNVHDRTGDTYISGPVTSPSFRDTYWLILPIPEDYPDKMPEMYVERPAPLYTSDGTLMPEISHVFHTMSRKSDCTQICHGSDEDWDASKTWISVLIRGHLWIHAFEQHLRTGETIEEVYRRKYEEQDSGVGGHVVPSAVNVSLEAIQLGDWNSISINDIDITHLVTDEDVVIPWPQT
ncbi:hypothetical protein ACFL1X_01475 [Candidatus Hydrogenedentota bacterium]